MTEEIKEFFSKYGGFILGIIIGAIVVALGIVDFIVAVAVIVGFGYLGMYVQRNKSKIKVTLKNLIEKW